MILTARTERAALAIITSVVVLAAIAGEELVQGGPGHVSAPPAVAAPNAPSYKQAPTGSTPSIRPHPVASPSSIPAQHTQLASTDASTTRRVIPHPAPQPTVTVTATPSPQPSSSPLPPQVSCVINVLGVRVCLPKT